MLNVKNGKNMIIDPESSCYDKVLRPIIECLKLLLLAQALTKAESVPLVHLSKAYSLSIYTKANEIIYFEVASHKTLITKARFCRVLGFASSDATKLFYTFIYDLYHGIKLDFGVVLWSQFFQSIVSATRHSDISCAWFWSIVVNLALDHFNVPLMSESVMAIILTLQTSLFMMPNRRNFNFVGTIPKVMLEKVPPDNGIANEYRKQPSSGVRPMSEEL